MKQMLKRGLRRFGFDIHRVGPGQSPELVDFLAARQVNTVLDVGANQGQIGMALRKKGYRGEIVSFEPIKTEFGALEAAARRDGNWRAQCLALGATPGHAIINVSRQSVFSSILDQSAAAQRFESAAAVEYQEEITIARLDDLSPVPRSNRVPEDRHAGLRAPNSRRWAGSPEARCRRATGVAACASLQEYVVAGGCAQV
jgi:FkbM family methyltransferase